ncbi:MAG: NADH-quinone oxidoreductase subunit J [Candidatus Thermoplasmatota archaeon]|jgi:NADH-quinone oxidoreductase subunit J|nr:NADH-quinone oxidoreductase subunit J [Candidatus Thermoplasmatota archaeon]MCL5954962.1 NADH-quinone oxidoreductase subunit J [Candidatus Thermoplasmatota archaeon]
MIFTIIFLIFAVMLVPLAMKSVTDRNITHAAVYLMAFLFILSASFIFLGASIVGAVELLVFIGAVVTLLVFTIMLTGGKEFE